MKTAPAIDLFPRQAESFLCPRLPANEMLPPNPLRSLFHIFPEPDIGSCVLCRVAKRGSIVVGRNYFARQAATLLRLARSTSNPDLAASLVEKATALQSQADETAPPP